MIKGHNPNRQQKSILLKNGYEWKDWLVIKVFTDRVVFRNKHTNETVIISTDNN